MSHMNSKKDLAEYLSERDDISLTEARYIIDFVQSQVNDFLGLLNEKAPDKGGEIILAIIQDLIADELGLEPDDYIELFLEDII